MGPRGAQGWAMQDKVGWYEWQAQAKGFLVKFSVSLRATRDDRAVVMLAMFQGQLPAKVMEHQRVKFPWPGVKHLYVRRKGSKTWGRCKAWAMPGGVVQWEVNMRTGMRVWDKDFVQGEVERFYNWLSPFLGETVEFELRGVLVPKEAKDAIERKSQVLDVQVLERTGQEQDGLVEAWGMPEGQ